MAPGAAGACPPPLEEPAVFVHAKSEELGLDFAIRIPVKSQRIDSFSGLLQDLATAVANGSAIDLRKKLEANHFASSLQQRAQMRREEREFYVQLGQRFEQMAATIQQLKRDYYREIDQLRDQLHAKRRDPRFQVDDISFFDPQAYKIPSWEQIAEHLDGLRMRRELEAQHGGQAVKHVPMFMLCQGCKGKFGSREGSDEVEPEGVAVQTELRGEGLSARTSCTSQEVQTGDLGVCGRRSLQVQTDISSPPGDWHLGPHAPQAPTDPSQTSSLAMQAASSGHAGAQKGRLGAPGAAGAEAGAVGGAALHGHAPPGGAQAGMPGAGGIEALRRGGGAGGAGEIAWEDFAVGSLRGSKDSSAASLRGSKDSVGSWPAMLPRGELQFAGLCRRCGRCALQDGDTDTLVTTSGGRTPATSSDPDPSTRSSSRSCGPQATGSRPGSSLAGGRPGSCGSADLETAKRGAMKVAQALKKLSRRLDEAPKPSVSMRLAFRKLKWHGVGSGLSTSQRRKLAAKMLERRMAALQAHLQRSALARMQSQGARDEWRKPEPTAVAPSVLSMSPSPLRRRGSLTPSSGPEAQVPRRRRGSTRATPPWESSPSPGPVWQGLSPPPGDASPQPSRNDAANARQGRWRALVATPPPERGHSAPSSSPESGPRALRSSPKQLNFVEWMVLKGRPWEGEVEAPLPRIEPEPRQPSLPSVVVKPALPSLLGTRPQRFAASS